MRAGFSPLLPPTVRGKKGGKKLLANRSGIVPLPLAFFAADHDATQLPGTATLHAGRGHEKTSLFYPPQGRGPKVMKMSATLGEDGNITLREEGNNQLKKGVGYTPLCIGLALLWLVLICVG